MTQQREGPSGTIPIHAGQRSTEGTQLRVAIRRYKRSNGGHSCLSIETTLS